MLEDWCMQGNGLPKHQESENGTIFRRAGLLRFRDKSCFKGFYKIYASCSRTITEKLIRISWVGLE